MARYTPDSRDRVRDAIDFVELVNTRTELRRAGPRSYEGLCPFHDERTPSFSVEPVEKVYYCFGCQASGDVFTFVQETEGVDFKGALELLADRAGIELQVEREDPREAERRARRERLLELLSRTTAYYERYLWESEEAAQARSYLEGRGLGEEICKEFRVGYAPSAWDRVLVASRRQGFSEQELYETGLAQRSQERGGLYDRFRARIMFPLADMRGRVLGFGARAMSEGRGPKYLNTSDNDVYHKGRHLYGADLARAHATKAGVAIVCEGYTDVIALHQAGFRNAVGLMGTALTDEQVGELGRLAQTVLLALDADSAGQEAMLKASRLAARRKLELRVVELPEGADPAELVQRGGAEAVQEAVARSAPFVRFRVERALAGGRRHEPRGSRPDDRRAEAGVRDAAAERDAHGAHQARVGAAGLERGTRRVAARGGGGQAAPPVGGRSRASERAGAGANGSGGQGMRTSSGPGARGGTGRTRAGRSRAGGPAGRGHRARVPRPVHRRARARAARARGGRPRGSVHERSLAPGGSASEGRLSRRAAERRGRRGPRDGGPARRADGRSGTLARLRALHQARDAGGTAAPAPARGDRPPHTRRARAGQRAR